MYKIVSKVMTNRLKVILPEIISLNQSAFMPGRMISDNVLLAHELTHFLQQKRNGGQSYAPLKLDMIKAYERGEWWFLENIMLKMGFSTRWVKLVMKCVSTVRYQIKVNNDMTGVIIP